MPLESTQSFEQDRNKYIDFRDMLADSSLSPEEVEDLKMRYDEECQEIESETMWLCSELLLEIEQYKEMTDMSREQIQKLQILTGIPKSQIDGLRGPTSFAQYQLFIDTTPELWQLWPKSLSEKYDEIFENAETEFNSLSSQERKDIQSQSWAAADGVFGPNTFQKICESISSDISLKVFLTGKSWVEEEQDTEKWAAEENDDMILNWAVDDWVLVSAAWDDILESEIDLSWDQEDMQALWDDMEVTSQATQEGVEIKPEELISQLKHQARDYPNSLIEELQAALWNIWVDGAFGNESANRILEKYPELTSLEDVFAAEGINTDIDGILSRDGSPEVFRNLYGAYIDTLGADLWLPDGFIEAIIKKETTYGAALNSPTGSKWMMQLTKWPFKDMRWDYGNRIGVDSAKVLRYQEIFQRVDLDALLAVQVWDEWPAWERIPTEIITHLRTVQNSENIAEIQQSITNLYEHIKGNRSEYDHETNMIIWSVYLAYQFDRADGDVWQTARNYNWDVKIASNGNQTRTNYANTVQRYLRNIQWRD